jgi:hypothetical protein
MPMKNSNDTIGNRSRDLPTCSAVPQPTAPPPRGPEINSRACFWVSTGPCPSLMFSLSSQHWIFLFIFFIETPRADSGPTKWLNGALPCELIGNFSSTYSRIAGDAKESHRIVGGNIVQRRLALLYQWSCSFSSPSISEPLDYHSKY